MNRYSVLSLVLLAVSSASPALARQFENPVHPRRVIVQVYDTFSGLPIQGAPVAMEGHSRMATTDEDGYAFVNYGGDVNPEVKTFWTSPTNMTIGYGDLTVDQDVEVLRLGVAPIDMYSTPLISANQGGVFVLSGPVVSGGAPDFWMEISVPAYSLPADGVLFVSPRPHNSIRNSGGYRFDGINEVSYCLADYSISFTTAGDERVESPQLNSPIGITTKCWCYRPLGDWAKAELEQVQLLTLDYQTKRLVPHADIAVLIDAGAQTKTFYLDHLSTWRERAFWTNAGSTLAFAWDDFSDWITGSAGTAPVPAPAPTTPTNPDAPQPDGGPVPGIGLSVSVQDICEDAGSLNVSCGKLVHSITADCANDGSASISASYLASLSAELGVDGNKLVSAITGVSGQLGLELEGGVQGGIQIGASETTTMSLNHGELVSNSLRGACLSGTATIVRVKKKLVITSPIATLEVPLAPCSRLGVRFEVGFDPQALCHWVDASGTGHDCTVDTPLPSVPDTAVCN
jgi:hypothetical protein